MSQIEFSGLEPHLEALTSAWQSERPHHAWILLGPKGIGKGGLARASIAALLGTKPGQSHPDFFEVIPEVAGTSKTARPTIGVDRLRGVCSQLKLTPSRAGWRVALIDEADEMTENAANALLKTLEEPPAKAMIVLVVHDLSKLPATIRSRCSLYRIAPPPAELAAQAVSAHLPGGDIALASQMLELAQGSPGRALSWIRQDAPRCWSELIALLSRPQPFERSGLQKFAADWSKDDAWDMTVELLLTLLYRAGQAAAGMEYAKTPFPGEDKLIKDISTRAGAAGVSWAWELALKFADDTRQQNLEKPYTIVRMMLGLEHALKKAAV